MALEWRIREDVPPNLYAVKAAAEGSRACDLWAKSTRTVFGKGPVHADASPRATRHHRRLVNVAR